MSNTGYKTGSFSLEGPNHPNEDRIIIAPNAYTDPKGEVIHIYGVLDGHGGGAIADFVVANYAKCILKPEKFEDIASMSDDEIKAAISEGFHKTDVRAIKKARKDRDWSGACALFVFIINKKMFVANLGDCRALRVSYSKEKFGGKPKMLTRDHQPLLDRERIEKAGGWIDPDGRVLGVLGCSRSFGDREFKYEEDRQLMKTQKKVDLLRKAKKAAEKKNNQLKKVSTTIVDKLVISEPEISVYPISETDGLLILGSDGVWDYCSNTTATKRFKKNHKAGMSLDKIAEEICTYARTAETGTNTDDITMVLIALNFEPNE